ncbi:MAG: AAA domain-containing protein [Propionibacteriales bacterium]|nr:AAA domain-containing protein [Propionibacteriales bacterium]
MNAEVRPVTDVGQDGPAAIAERLLSNVETVVLGKRDEIKLVLGAMLCGGHVLLEDVPGTAKTVLARALAGTIERSTFARVQCTPDLQPSDVTGLSVFDQKTRDFEFRPGPVFANIVLVDEINRAMPKTQSALLEAMAERQITIDRVTRPLPDPFLVLATENPIEHEGTFPLPEAQLDRFLVRGGLGYPGSENELRIMRDQRHGHPIASLDPAVTLEELQKLQRAVEDVYMDELIERWIVRLIETTRESEQTAVGASVRGTLALDRLARAWALLDGRSFVRPGDVERLFLPVVAHRIVFRPAFLAEARRSGREAALEAFETGCLEAAPAPELRDADLAGDTVVR